MKLSDIVILRKINPITLVAKPSLKTLEFLNNIIKNKEFEEFVIATRRQYCISVKGLDIKKLVGFNLYDLGDTNINTYKILVEEYRRSTGMPTEYALEIFLLVFFNSIIDLRYFKTDPSLPNEFIFGRKKIADKMWDYDHEVGAILLPFNITKTKLKKWIDKNWDSINDVMINNFTSNPFILRVHENLMYEEEIRDLKNMKDKTFTDIHKIFETKYPKMKWKLTRIKKIYYDSRQRESLEKLLYQRKK